ncbi:MAG TPA: ABC transporter permease [Rhodocyclaceae bacterium]
MRADDFLRLALRALLAQRMRSFLTLLGIAVGIAAVILLTSIGEGLHRYVMNEFTQFGTNIVEIKPGKNTGSGGPGGLQTTVRPLTIADARALERIANVTAVTPVIWSNAEVEANVSGNARVRRTVIYGVGPSFLEAFQSSVRAGRFLPNDDSESARAFVVLGAKLKAELFGPENPLGERLRIGGLQFRVIGVMEPKGQILGQDLDDTAFIPTARALEMLNKEGVAQINVSYAEGVPAASVVRAVKAMLIARHGREDFSIVTQEDMLRTLSKILDVLTVAVGALGGISLLVGGVGIVTIMTISVAERTNEIGLLKAVGAPQQTILLLFLGEAVALSLVGGSLGLAAGAGLAQLLNLFLPALPVHTPWRFVLWAELASALIGLAAGVLPAKRAAGLDPVEALHAE